MCSSKPNSTRTRTRRQRTSIRWIMPIKTTWITKLEREKTTSTQPNIDDVRREHEREKRRTAALRAGLDKETVKESLVLLDSHFISTKQVYHKRTSRVGEWKMCPSDSFIHSFFPFTWETSHNIVSLFARGRFRRNDWLLFGTSSQFSRVKK